MRPMPRRGDERMPDKAADFLPDAPLMMYQYNGPDSQTVLNEWKMDGVYYIAPAGVCGGYGRRQGTGNRSRKMGECRLPQLRSSGDGRPDRRSAHIAKLPEYVERMACFGWSYGGYMTLWNLRPQTLRSRPEYRWFQLPTGVCNDSILYGKIYVDTAGKSFGYDSASARQDRKSKRSSSLIMSGTSDDNTISHNTLKYTSKIRITKESIFDMMALADSSTAFRMCNACSRLYPKIVDFLIPLEAKRDPAMNDLNKIDSSRFFAF